MKFSEWFMKFIDDGLEIKTRRDRLWKKTKLPNIPLGTVTLKQKLGHNGKQTGSISLVRESDRWKMTGLFVCQIEDERVVCLSDWRSGQTRLCHMYSRTKPKCEVEIWLKVGGPMWTKTWIYIGKVTTGLEFSLHWDVCGVSRKGERVFRCEK